MKISVMPKHTASELLMFLADHEQFLSAAGLLGGGITPEEIGTLLREISAGLMQESLKESKYEKFDVKNDVNLSKQAKNILSYLSPHEEKTLLEAFGLVEKS
jgi:hypothetical protein